MAAAGEVANKHSVPEPSLPPNPIKFLCGVAVSVYQNSGDPNSNWAWFEKQKSFALNFKLRLSSGDTARLDPMDHYGTNVAISLKNAGPSVIVQGERLGKGSDFWNNHALDIKNAAEIGCNSFRLSLEWSRIMPREGFVDEAAVQHYHKIFDCIEQHNMEANVSLHWFVHPMWFERKGGFTKAANIHYFVEWAELAFKRFGQRSRLWATFNEPAVAALCGHIAGNHPPGKLCHFKVAAYVLKHELWAHAQAYRAIKALPGGRDTAVGIVHNVFWTEPKRKNIFYSHVRLAVSFANRVWGNETVMNYLKTGVFHHWLPVARSVHWEDPDGKPGCDFFGLNHYSRGVVDWKLQPSNKGPRGLADMGYPLYPPSLYRAISYSSTLGVPMYVMENGMPDAEDSRRDEWINGYLGQVQKAVEDGYDLRGYMYWTLVDNFEWNFAYELKFGLYEWNPEWGDSRKRVFRQGAKPIIKWYKELPDKLGKLLEGNTGNPKRGPGDPTQARGLQDKELQQEIDYLRSEGYDDKSIQEAIPEEKDPVTAGVHPMKDGSERL